MRSADVIKPSVPRTSGVEPSRRLRAKATNNPIGRAGNTARGRRIRDLYRVFLRIMGDPVDAVSQAAAVRAAELTVAAEDARMKLLAGGGDIDQVVRLEGVARRAVADLDRGRQR
jgi:hypothetical protein